VRLGIEPFLVRALLIGWSVPITHAKGLPLVELGRIRELMEGDYAPTTKNGGSGNHPKTAVKEAVNPHES
jgi:hypothetical protein